MEPNFVRMVPCPHCSRQLDVTRFDPLEQVQCGCCTKSFDLLREFGEYMLLKSYSSGWKSSSFLAKHQKAEELAVVKILGAHAFGQAGALEEFQAEMERVRELCSIELVSDFKTGSEHGFPFFAIHVAAGVSELQVLELVGVEFDREETVKTREKPVPVRIERKIDCPNCLAQIDVTHLDPLDRVTCHKCQDYFQILRQFGDFKIDSRLSLGGSSVLYIAYHRRLRKNVALKVLSAIEMAANPESVERFLRESELTQRLLHPNIIQVYESGQYKNFYYIALELVEGMTLDDIMEHIHRRTEVPDGEPTSSLSPRKRSRPALPELICLEIILQAASGLGVAHEQGLVHGDIKPSNIMITYDGYVKVLDFGLVQFQNAQKLFEEGEDFAIQGTPLYIPPERVRGEPEDFRSDIYGLGASLYHMLRGVAPFTAKTASEVAMMHAQSPLLVFSAVAPWVSEQTCRIVEKSMKKNVADRYSSHFEFLADIALARNQILNQIPGKSRDGKLILRNFMKEFPSAREGFSIWKQTHTTAIRTFKSS
jgi:serine/threonine protein kinase